MTWRKFKPWRYLDKQTIPCGTCMRATHGRTALLSSSARYPAILLASVAPNIRENPQRALWNNNNNAEFEGGRQNIIVCSCMKAVYNYILYVHSRKKYHHCTWHLGVSLTRKSTNQQWHATKRYRRSDPCRINETDLLYVRKIVSAGSRYLCYMCWARHIGSWDLTLFKLIKNLDQGSFLFRSRIQHGRLFYALCGNY